MIKENLFRGQTILGGRLVHKVKVRISKIIRRDRQLRLLTIIEKVSKYMWHQSLMHLFIITLYCNSSAHVHIVFTFIFAFKPDGGYF